MNGEPYYSLANDLYELIKTCNKNSKKQFINLKYFCSIKNEIEGYYNAAYEILRKGRRTFQNRPAMINILNGCEEPADAQEKKVLFLKRLNYKGFQEYDDTEYTEESYKYNIIDSKTLEKLQEQFPHYNEHELVHIQQVLNKINHLRKGQGASFYKAGHFFVTETSAMLNVSLHSSILRPDLVPLATSIEYLTERIWIKTNSTFGNDKPKTVNAVIIAQLILSMQVNISIKDKYEELQDRYKKDRITEEDAHEILATLKETRSHTQNITPGNAEEIVDFLDSTIDDMIKKHDKLIERADMAEKKVEQLTQENKDSSEKLDEFEQKEIEQKLANNKSRILKNHLAVIIISFIISGISGIVSRFLGDGYIRLICDIFNTLGFTICIITASFMFIKLRILEKKSMRDW